MQISKAYSWIIVLSILIIAFACADKVLANYQLSRYPLDEIAKVTANYGQYRNYSSNYMVHDGVDLAGGIQGKPVYPVAEGVIETIGWSVDKDGKSTGFGRHIIVRHDKAVPVYRTMYAHLRKEVAFNPETGKPYENGNRVYSYQPIGKVGSTGKSSGPHLHFNIGQGTLVGVNGSQENPIAAGLPQLYSLENTSRIIKNKKAVYGTDEYVRIIGTGKDGRFDEGTAVGENEEVNFPEPNKTYKIIVEAYQNPDDPKYNTNPYGIEFIIERLWPRDASENKHEIRRFN